MKKSLKGTSAPAEPKSRGSREYRTLTPKLEPSPTYAWSGAGL
jgi:hypothetical protein